MMLLTVFVEGSIPPHLFVKIANSKPWHSHELYPEKSWDDVWVSPRASPDDWHRRIHCDRDRTPPSLTGDSLPLAECPRVGLSRNALHHTEFGAHYPASPDFWPQSSVGGDCH